MQPNSLEMLLVIMAFSGVACNFGLVRGVGLSSVEFTGCALLLSFQMSGLLPMLMPVHANRAAMLFSLVRKVAMSQSAPPTTCDFAGCSFSEVLQLPDMLLLLVSVHANRAATLYMLVRKVAWS